MPRPRVALAATCVVVSAGVIIALAVWPSSSTATDARTYEALRPSEPTVVKIDGTRLSWSSPVSVPGGGPLTYTVVYRAPDAEQWSVYARGSAEQFVVLGAGNPAECAAANPGWECVLGAGGWPVGAQVAVFARDSEVLGRMGFPSSSG